MCVCVGGVSISSQISHQSLSADSSCTMTHIPPDVPSPESGARAYTRQRRPFGPNFPPARPAADVAARNLCVTRSDTCGCLGWGGGGGMRKTSRKRQATRAAGRAASLPGRAKTRAGTDSHPGTTAQLGPNARRSVVLSLFCLNSHKRADAASGRKSLLTMSAGGGAQKPP